MPLVLAIEPDLRQAAILKRLVREKVRADVVVVDSPDAALAAIRMQIPDVLLLSALLSPRDENELIAHLRALDGSDHIQTHTIPQLASTGAYQDDQGGKGRGLLGMFKRGKKDTGGPASGCDPELFADEILTFLRLAAERKAEGAALLQSRVNRLEYEGLKSTASAQSGASIARTAHEEPVTEPDSSASAWASPFEWRPTARKEAPASAVVEKPSENAPVIDPVTSYDALTDATPTAAEELEARSYAWEETPTPEIADGSAAPEAVRDVEAPPPPMPILEPTIPTIVEARAPAKAVDEAPARQSRRKRSPGGSTIPPAAILRLTPLAMWARSEADANGSSGGSQPQEPKTATDELRSLIATLAVPSHVAGVSYGRGCRIRRVRVPGGKDKRRGEVPGPVILSRRALEQQRGTT